MSGRKALLVATLALALAAPISSAVDRASAAAPIISFEAAPSTNQAGARADVLTRAYMRLFDTPLDCLCNTVRRLTQNMPAGVVATPRSTPQCTDADFALSQCAPESQVGLAILGGDDPNFNSYVVPIYSLIPAPGQLGLLAFPVPIAHTPIYILVSARTESDYGLEFVTTGIPRLGAPTITTLIWGVPAADSHNALRFPFDHPSKELYCGFTGTTGDGNPLPELLAGVLPTADCPVGGHEPVAANTPPTPFTSNPTSCEGPITASAESLAFDLETDFAEAPYPTPTGCDQLDFSPSLAARPTTMEADSPSGLDIDLKVPQTLSPDHPSPSAIREISVQLPEGFTINSNAADGKVSCTAAQARFGTREAAQCPDYAKIGTLGVVSAAFPEVLPGAIYLGEPLPGERYRLFMVFDGFSLHVKLQGVVEPDAVTGQVTASFRNLPQFNFEEFDMHFFGAERGLLSTPEQCGTYPVESTFTPWAAPAIPTQTSTQFFVIDSGPGGRPCPGTPRPFAPRFSAGVTDATAARHSTFTLKLERPDGDQNLSDLTLTGPPGFSASLKGVPYCPDAAIAGLRSAAYSGLLELASPVCPSESRVGTVQAAAGAGSKPFYVDGRVYLAGPYRSSPISLLFVIPAVSGPYDLGNVAVRVALDVDPITARVTATSDPLPQILEGVPLRTREIRVDIDRPGFALNPTNCSPFSVRAAAGGDEGAKADLSSHFQVADCAGLRYGPTMSLRLAGGVNRRGHPAIHSVIQTKPGEANNRSISVTLPPGELLDQSHIRTICTRVQFAADRCPGGAVVGQAEVSSPLLERPLAGKVYLRSSSHDLPDLALDLEGQFEIEAVARVDSFRGRLRATFGALPDVPVSRIDFHLLGGSRGLLENSEGLCGAGKKAMVRMTGQNGRFVTRKVGLHPACGWKKKR